MLKRNIFKTIVTAVIALAFSFSVVGVNSAHADSGRVEDCRYFLGMVSWDCNTGFTDGTEMNTEQLTKGAWTMVFNILSDISVIAAYLVLGYVIYGGYQYIFSAGDPTKVITGKKTLTHAFIGLAIVMSASVILNAVRIALGADFTKNCTLADECISAGDMVTNLIGWVIAISGLVAIIFVVVGGISYMTSGGEPNRMQKAKSVILYALIGLMIVGLAQIITAFVTNVIRTANEAALIDDITIAKEINEKEN